MKKTYKGLFFAVLVSVSVIANGLTISDVFDIGASHGDQLSKVTATISGGTAPYTLQSATYTLYTSTDCTTGSQSIIISGLSGQYPQIVSGTPVYFRGRAAGEGAKRNSGGGPYNSMKVGAFLIRDDNDDTANVTTLTNGDNNGCTEITCQIDTPPYNCAIKEGEPQGSQTINITSFS
ncbi:MAG: hypothetical protein P1U40_09015 [Coxiellaceae bacterium]|nr:hypothetical protein [Coxiellaceae bacterium]